MEGCSNFDAKGVNATDELDDGSSSWVAACQEGDLAIVKQFMVKGQSVAAMNAGLRHAAGAGKAEIVSYLLPRGAIVDGSDAKGFPPLFFAEKVVIWGSARCWSEMRLKRPRNQMKEVPRVIYFLDKVKNVDYKNSLGTTALIAASSHGKANVVSYLLSQGARIDETDAIGYTPLYVAAQFGHLKVCQQLFVKGSDPLSKLKHWTVFWPTYVLFEAVLYVPSMFLSWLPLYMLVKTIIVLYMMFVI
uniref:ANK_REP_REGION domain-containing protein n=1 Tax=Globodera pallida TaxID=36090 RepID=A0A183CDC7_GLOPA